MCDLSHGWKRINFEIVQASLFTPVYLIWFFGRESFLKLFERCCLPLPIRFNLVGYSHKINMLIYFSIFNSFLCANPVTSFLVLTTVLHYVKSVRIRNYFHPHFSRIFLPHSDWIRRDTLYPSVFSSNTGKCVKNADQCNSEYGHSLRSVTFLCASLIIVTVRQGI